VAVASFSNQERRWRSRVIAEPSGRLSTMPWSRSRRRCISRAAVLVAFASALCQGVMVIAGYTTGLVDRLAAVVAAVVAAFILAILLHSLKKTDSSHSSVPSSPLTPQHRKEQPRLQLRCCCCRAAMIEARMWPPATLWMRIFRHSVSARIAEPDPPDLRVLADDGAVVIGHA